MLLKSGASQGGEIGFSITSELHDILGPKIKSNLVQSNG
jgi:hypothetical protein